MDSMTLILAYVVVGGAAVWFFGRKQRRRAQEIQAQRDAMKIGDEVVTIGGLHGVIERISEDKQTVDLNCEGVVLVFERVAIHHVVTTPTLTNEEIHVDEPVVEEE